IGTELVLPLELGRAVRADEHPPRQVRVAAPRVLQLAPAAPLDEIEPELRERLLDRHARSIPFTRSMFATSSGSTSPVSRNAPRISRARIGVDRRKLIARTFASFHRRAPRAVSAPVHSAARTPFSLFAAIEQPVPVQQN